MDVENLTSNFILLIWIHVIYVRYMFQNAQWLYEANINPSRSPKNIMATKSTQKISSNFYPTCSQGNVSAGSIIGLGYLWYQNILKKPWHSAENGFTWSSKFTGAIKQCTPQRMACTHTHIHRSIRYEQLPFASLICSTLVPWKKHMPKKDMVSDRLHWTREDPDLFFCCEAISNPVQVGLDEPQPNARAGIFQFGGGIEKWCRV